MVYQDKFYEVMILMMIGVMMMSL